jgi:elongation factor Ts
MSEIKATDVVKIREVTGAGMMDCKKALVEAAGDVAKAIELLRKKGAATAAKKSVREAREGVIAQHLAPGGRLGVLVEVNCETDFVARNEGFRAFAEEIAKALADDANANLESAREAAVAKIRENIKIPRHARMEVQGHGLIAGYIHTGAKVGVLVEVGAGKAETAGRDEFKQLVRDITLQIAAASPMTVTRDQLDATMLAKEREIAQEQVKDKPPQAIAKIVEGKMEKFFQTYCLVDQGFVKKNGEITVKDHVAATAKVLDDELSLRRFVRFQVGETPVA